jgi:predicted nuclease with TOPRIM domain
MTARIKQLEAENAALYKMSENLKYQEAMSRHKVEDLSQQVHSLSQERI